MRHGRWLVGVAGLAAVLLGLLALWHRGQLLDLHIYRLAGRSIGTDRLYDFRDPQSGLPFTYPPFAGVLFSAFGLVSEGAAAIVMTVASALAATALAGLVARRLPLDRSWWPAATVLVLAIGAAGEPVQSTIEFGQVNLVLFLLVAWAVLLPGRLPAIGLGVAAGIKLTPAIFIVGLFLTGRPREGWVATASALATVGVGAAVLPRSTVAFFGGAGFSAQRIGTPQFIANQSLNGLWWRLFGPGGSPVLWAVSAGLVLVAGLFGARRSARRQDQLAALAILAVTGLLVSPISWGHHWVPVMVIVPVLLRPLLGPDPFRPGRWPGYLLAAGWLAVTADRLIWQLPRGADQEYHESFWVFLGASSYVELGLLTLLALVIGRGGAVDTPWAANARNGPAVVVQSRS